MIAKYNIDEHQEIYIYRKEQYEYNNRQNTSVQQLQNL